MKRLLAFTVLLFTMGGCSSAGNEKPVEVNTVDSAVLIPESNVPVDTEDHNRPGESDIALDSPIGPHSLNDTLKNNY
ncbi:MAG: hypothetical protein JWP88_96 [Flaviaesturariibacter sp.]|nr:hypothetical protein [Flaviaesturariibacter sp.]